MKVVNGSAPAQPTTWPASRASPALGARWAALLQRSLFPAPSASRVGRPLCWLGYLVGLAAVAALALLRQAGDPAWETMWAEDGKVFYSQALLLPFARSLVTPHAGYVQLFPRLVAGGATLFPPRLASVVMALAGALSLGVLSCLVFHMARGHVPSRLSRLVLCASMVLLPVASGELLDNAVNVPWWLFFACFWALLWWPRSSAGYFVGFCTCALAGASEPLVALLLPLAALRVLALREPAPVNRGDPSDGLPGASGSSRRLLQAGEHSHRFSKRAGPSRLLPQAGDFSQGASLPGTSTSCNWATRYAPSAGLLAGLAFQAFTILANGSGSGATTSFAPFNAKAAVQAFATRVGLGLLAGVKGTNWLAAHHFGAAVGLGLVVTCLLAAAGTGCPRPPARAFALLATGLAIGCFALEAWVRGMALVLVADHAQVAGRYQAFPLLLLVSSLVVSAESWLGTRRCARPPSAPRSRRRRSARHRERVLAAAICAVLLAPTWAVDFRDPNARSGGPRWADGIESAKAKCASENLVITTVPIDPPGWEAQLPCAALAAGHRRRSAGLAGAQRASPALEGASPALDGPRRREHWR